MADIRINALATTASSTASDDFLAVDGSANGTRKLNAYSPTFGGNVVATGTLTVNSTTDSSSKDTGAIITEGGLGVEKSATIGGNLTVSGTAGSWASGVSAIDLSTSATLYGTAADVGLVSNAYYDGAWKRKTANATGRYQFQLGSGDHIWYSAGSGSANSSITFTQAMTLTNSGNLLIGTTTDSGNGKLQLANHTTSAGGIGFGTDTALYRATAQSLNLDGASSPQFSLSVSGTQKARLESYSDDLYISTLTAGKSIILRSGNATTALTLDSSQNATFAGAIAINNTVNTVSPTSPNRTITMVIGGTTYYIHAKTTND